VTKLSFGIAILYKLEVVGSQVALYKRFRIKIWDMFDNFDPN